jgi:tRNA pseudouridine38-40 synthase
MVRNIAGVLMDIGQGKQPITWVEDLLAIKDRKQGGITASPYGLHLGGVFYPEKYGITKHPVFNLLKPGTQRFKY